MAVSTSEADDDALPISGLQHLAFCPRQWALIHLEQVWVENVRTAEGRLLHERADLPGESRRASVRTVRGMWLRSERLHLTGRADIVEFRPATLSRGIQARQEQAQRLRYGAALCAGALSGGDVAARRLNAAQSSTAIHDGGWRLTSHRSSRPNGRTRGDHAPFVPKPA